MDQLFAEVAAVPNEHSVAEQGAAYLADLLADARELLSVIHASIGERVSEPALCFQRLLTQPLTSHLIKHLLGRH